MIGIVDYGAGNLHSVEKAFRRLGLDACVTGDAQTLLRADRVALPGVGAIGDAMARLTERGLDRVIRRIIADGTPLLGICLGMQMMYETSEEGGSVAGLGILKGRIRRFPDDMGLKVPEIGWNRLRIRRASHLLDGLTDPYVYFVHSYYVDAFDPNDVIATTRYGVEPHVAVEHDNLFLTQFHPEKSGETGLRILANFAAIPSPTR